MCCHVTCVNFSCVISTVMATGDQRLVGRALNSQRLFSWGANSYGQLASGHCEDTLKPEEFPPKCGNITQINGGGGHTLIISDGKLMVCGSNEKGQLGIGSTENVSVLTPVRPLEDEIIRKAVGGWDFSVVINDKGEVFTFGSNTFGQLGLPDQTVNHVTIPTKLHLPEDPRIVDIAAGLRHVVAVSDKGHLYTWGGRMKEKVQQKDKKSQNQSPVMVSLPQLEGKIIQVRAGSYLSAALTDCGEIICWGDNKYGQLAQSPDTVRNLSDPAIIPVTLFDGKVIDIQTGWTHMAAMTETGKVYSWGRADYGQLGREVQMQYDPTPQPITGLGNVICVKCGSEHNMALSGEGRLMTWGWNEHGLCGNGNETNVLIPHQVAAFSDHVIKLIGCGAGHSFAMINDT